MSCYVLTVNRMIDDARRISREHRAVVIHQINIKTQEFLRKQCPSSFAKLSVILRKLNLMLKLYPARVPYTCDSTFVSRSLFESSERGISKLSKLKLQACSGFIMRASPVASTRLHLKLNIIISDFVIRSSSRSERK